MIGQPIARGRTAEIYEWQDNRILKLFKAGSSADMVEREFQTTIAVYKTGLPVPAVEEMIEVDDRLGIVFERIEGRSMSAFLMQKPWQMFGMARVMAELHLEMHTCELPELPSRKERLEIAIQSVDVLPDNTRNAVLDVLHRLPDGNAICHGDLFVDNIMISPKGAVIIDWFGAARGDPVADVARTCLLNRLAYLKAGLPERWIIKLVRDLFHRAYLRRYLKDSPTSKKEIRMWLIPVLAARLLENIPEEKEPFIAMIERLLKRA